MSYIIGSLPPIKCFVKKEFLYDFKAAQTIFTVDGTRKWSAGDDWFYSIEERKE